MGATDTERFIADRRTAEEVRQLVSRLVDLKEIQNISTKEIAAKSGLDYETIYNLEMWPHDPRLSLILKYARAIDVKIDIRIISSVDEDMNLF